MNLFLFCLKYLTNLLEAFSFRKKVNTVETLKLLYLFLLTQKNTSIILFALPVPFQAPFVCLTSINFLFALYSRC